VTGYQRIVQALREVKAMDELRAAGLAVERGDEAVSQAVADGATAVPPDASPGRDGAAQRDDPGGPGMAAGPPIAPERWRAGSA
jgi:hypothetical protein